MPWGAAIAAGGAILGGVMSSNSAKDAAGQAAQGSKMAMYQQMQNQAMINKWLKPYREAGYGGLAGQRDLVGLNGEAAQASAIAALEKSPQFSSLVEQGENALRQNASATGGLRGGNTAAALAQFRPQMLSQIIESQYAKLGGLAASGQNAAVQAGGFAQQGAGNISNLLNQQGQIGSNLAMAQGANMQNMIGGLAGAYGQYQGNQQFQDLLNALGGGKKV